jgi:hypothetical protein
MAKPSATSAAATMTTANCHHREREVTGVAAPGIVVGAAGPVDAALAEGEPAGGCVAVVFDGGSRRVIPL